MKNYFRLSGVALMLGGGLLPAQLRPVPKFPLPDSPMTIRQAPREFEPFTVAGETGAIIGQQNGSFEAWAFPLKILSHLRITAEMQDYPVPIELNQHAALITVHPAYTSITYSHAAMTVKQHMFTSSAGAMVLFEISAIRPLRLTFRFTPELLRMWPAPNFGRPNAEWVKAGYYLLHTDNAGVSAAIGMPHSTPGTLAPYQERPRTFPVEMNLAFDPKKDSDSFFPLLMTAGRESEKLGNRLEELNRRVASLFQETLQRYDRFFDTRLWVETPDADFDKAMRWAVVAVDQCRVRFGQETGMVAGFYASADSARPGFAWFFGRDTLWTLYAIHAYGDFGLSRQALEFLVRRQRADGKIMHEFSQSADLVDWKSLPYWYASADSTPLLVMAFEDYLNTSGDLAFVRRNWDAIRRAYAFTRAHDSDGDGIYENTEGTGWVESWPSGMPHQEVYLAALDAQSAGSMARLAAAMRDEALAASARQSEQRIRRALLAEYYDAGRQFYAFSRNADGTLDHTATVYPSVAWWDGRLELPKSDAMLSRWAAPEFSTDWGLRDVSAREPIYDPISYHQGSVWPLFTGWTSLAEYRAGRTLSGYAHLMQNAGLTFTQDPGAATELLSGDYFQPLGRSTSHQMWSSAMILTPALRGLFGLGWNAAQHTLSVNPHLPASWEHARLHNVPLGAARVDLEMSREGGKLIIRGRASGEALCLAAHAEPANGPCSAELTLPLPAVELELPHALPDPGSSTSQLKAVGEQWSANQLMLTLEAPGGSSHDLFLRRNAGNVHVTGAELLPNRIRVRFPQGSGYQTQVVKFTW